MTAMCVSLRLGPVQMSYADIASALKSEFPGLDSIPHRSTIMRRIKTFRQGYTSDVAAYEDALSILE